MSSTYSNSLRIELIGNGDQAGTWGATTNSSFANILDTAIAGYVTVSVISADQALTQISGATPVSSLNQSIYAMLQFTTTTGAAFNVYAPPVPKQYVIWNNSGHSMTIYNSATIGGITPPIAPNGIGVTIANDKKVIVFSDGANFYTIDAASLTATLPIASGGTGQVTANAAFNALAPSQGSANGKYLKSDGTNTSWDQIDISTGDITGTLPVANGGTGVTTSTGTGNNVLSTSPTITTPTFSGTVTLGTNWSVVETAGVLYFAYGGVNKAKIDSSGNLTVAGNVTAYGTV